MALEKGALGEACKVHKICHVRVLAVYHKCNNKNSRNCYERFDSKQTIGNCSNETIARHSQRLRKC